MRNDIIRMAQEAGINLLVNFDDGTRVADRYIVSHRVHTSGSLEALENFASLIATAERQACAKVCEAVAEESLKGESAAASHYAAGAEDCAAHILARGKA